MGSVNIHATVTSLVAPGTLSPLQLASPAMIRNPAGSRALGATISQKLSTDLDNVRTSVNALISAAQTPPSVSQILLTDSKTGLVVAAIGNLTYQGVPYVNYLSEIHVGNPLQTRDPAQSLFNANTDGSVTIGQNGWLDVHDPYSGNAAWIGTQFDTLPVSGASSSGSGAVRLTVNNHTLASGNQPTVRNMQNAGVPNATGQWTATVVDENTIDLQQSVWAGSFVAPPSPGGINTNAPTIDRILQVTGCIQTPMGTTIRLVFGVATGYESGTAVDVANIGGVPAATGQWITSIPATLAVTGAADNGAGLIRLTAPGQNFNTGDKPQVLGVGGVPNADGFWVVTVIDATHIDLQGSTFLGAYTSGGTVSFLNANVVDLAESPYTDAPSVFAGAYTSGGTCLQYFAGVLAESIAVGPSFSDYKLRAFPSGDLRIRNAEIELSSAAGSITLDPTTAQIVMQSATTLASIVIDASVPSLTFFDQEGQQDVALEILNETALPVSAATNASPVVMTVPGCVTANPSGFPYVNGDTVFVAGATANTIINGYRIIENVSVNGPDTFTMTNLQGAAINGNGAFAGTVTATRFFAGLLAQSMAIGGNWNGYRLRFFADGRLVLHTVSIDNAVITNSTISGGSATVTQVTLMSEAAPATPPAGEFIIFMDSADNSLKAKGPSGTVTVLALP